MKFAKIPNIVALPTIIINSQKFSWTAGQWYFVFDRLMITSSLTVVAVDAMTGDWFCVAETERQGGFF